MLGAMRSSPRWPHEDDSLDDGAGNDWLFGLWSEDALVGRTNPLRRMALYSDLDMIRRLAVLCAAFFQIWIPKYFHF